MESKRIPRGKEGKRTEPNRTEGNRKEKNRTEPKPIIIGSREEASGFHRHPERSVAESKDLLPEEGDSSPVAQNDTHAATYDEIREIDRNQDTILLAEERDGVVHLTHREAYNLLTTLGAHKARYYVQKLAKFIKEHNANIKDHYDTILKWFEEDGGTYYG